MSPIRDALERLPILGDRQSRIEDVEYCLELGCGGSLLADLDHPKNRSVGSARATASLATFEELSRALREHIDTMPREAVEALAVELEAEERLRQKLMHASVRDSVMDWAQKAISLDNLSNRLDRFEGFANRAAVACSAGDIPGRKGALPKEHALALTRLAAWAYEELAGERPTIKTLVVPVTMHQNSSKAGGPFLEFLDALFGIAGIQASPEAQARKVLMEKIGPSESN